MSRLWWLLLLLVPLPFVLPLGCSAAPDPWAGETAPTRVVVTIAPLASWVRGVGGDRVAVRCICTTTGPHHYTADYRDARLMEKAHAAFSVGLELDESFPDALCRIARRSDLPHVKLGERLPAGMVHKMRAHQHAPDEECDHHHGEYDPHVWLGAEQAAYMVGVIRDELCKVDPEYAGMYKANADVYLAQLAKLHEEGKAMLADKTNKRIISFHDAFDYFARSYGLEVAGVIELSPDTNPSSYHLTELEKLCQEKPVGAITVEPQYPDSTSARRLKEGLARRKIDIPLVSIDPLETAEADELAREGATWYETRMRKNLQALADVLK